jgi:predicted MPP superfamily phosphohydrolase
MHVARAQDWIVILTVLGCAVALYGSAAFLLLRRFMVPADIRPKLGRTGILVLVCTALSFCFLWYAYFVEPYTLQVTHVKIPLNNLPANTKPITIVQVSDLHCDATMRLEDRVAQEIEKIKPSLILFTGDAVNSLDGTPIFNAFAARISKVARTLAVKGDWDFAFHPVNVLENSKLELVSGGYRLVQLNGISICIVGADSGASCRAALDKAPKGMPTIVMYHNPDADLILDNDTAGVDLYLCGHTHGGQIALPVYGALITQSVQGKKYESGLHKLGNTWIYTTRGIGMEGHFPRLRFCAPPELTVIELCSQSPN